MCHRCGQLDMPHSFSANLALDHLHAALLAHDAPVFHSFIFATVAFIVLDGPEYL